MKPPPFRYHRPGSVAEAVRVLSEAGDEAKVLAGGQSLMPLLNMRLVRPTDLVDVNRVPELGEIRVAGGELVLGATARVVAVERSAVVADRWPVLARGLGEVGHYQIRSRGTVGGSVAHADPAAELPALLVALDGRVVTESPRGRREIPAGDCFLGAFTTGVAPDEIVVELRIPSLPDGAGAGFAELARRRGDFALAGAVCVRRGAHRPSTVVLFGVSARPVRILVAAGAEPADVSRAVDDALDPGDVMSDIHAGARWRAKVAAVMAARAYGEAA
jgi:aerobic carbon-monoxide dehydrogenase medium subunit